MQILAWIFLTTGILMLLAPFLMLAWAWGDLWVNYQTYHDTYQLTVSVGWPALFYVASSILTLCSGLWLLMKTKRG